ncbi:MAG TPA: CPXCG motif-containing cysteine-rich protein [Dyella sp.]|uniref:CPXCG motif-containing cysteine-rich protein n=1 Tax=Dyella sp. TaxID=1869338 RepID=UPI002CE3A8FF|nr:CPXCG motif-containing cysteine-rich protein [Dyella sp.]HTV86464.1 CPXCG motif-containing cysteine-rich protein [Dyella sp.]
MLDPHTIQCPYCGEHIQILIDASAGSEQSYVEDCQVCCAPIDIHVRIGEDGHAHVTAAGQNDA